MRPLPQTVSEWIDEIAAAYQDAREAMPFAPIVDMTAGEGDLFHFAPHVAIKFRGLRTSKRSIAVKAALSSYVANEGTAPIDDPYLAFAFCYLASHFGLDLVSEGAVEEVMAVLESTVLGGRARKPLRQQRGPRTGQGLDGLAVGRRRTAGAGHRKARKRKGAS